MCKGFMKKGSVVAKEQCSAERALERGVRARIMLHAINSVGGS
jgi:hypothetical protein